MRRIVVFLSLLWVGYASLAYASINNSSEQEKISYLLDAVGASPAIFIRNGTEYSGIDAKAHLKMKLEAAGDAIHTVDDFINGIASHSSMTGEPYYVKFPDGTKMESKVWLYEMLDHR